MKKFSFIVLLFTLSQAAFATMYLVEPGPNGRRFGPYYGDCKSYGKVSNFRCVDAPVMRPPKEIEIHNDSVQPRGERVREPVLQ